MDGLSLCTSEHQILALLGHNGAGKTTTINMLIGLLSPDEGVCVYVCVCVCVCVYYRNMCVCERKYMYMPGVC